MVCCCCPCFGSREAAYSSITEEGKVADGGPGKAVVSNLVSSSYLALGGGPATSTVVSGIGIPRWVQDEEVEKCYGCGAMFDFSNRRHHCRRCRNVFCSACSPRQRPVRVYKHHEPVRVCTRCFGEVARENDFLQYHLPRLLQGDEFVSNKGLVMGRLPVVVRLLPGLENLEVHERDGQKFRVALRNMNGVSEDGRLGIRVGVSGMSALRLETSSTQKRQAWVAALGEATHVIPQIVSFKTRIEKERAERAKVEEKAREKRMLAERRAKKSADRNALASKYGLDQRY